MKIQKEVLEVICVIKPKVMRNIRLEKPLTPEFKQQSNVGSGS